MAESITARFWFSNLGGLDYNTPISIGSIMYMQRMRDVKSMTVLLEYLCESLSGTPQYRNALWCLIRLCQKPPLLTKRSEILEAEETLKDYFTGLGNCLIVVEDPDLKTLIIEVLHNLLGKRDEDDVPYDVCVRSLVKSEIGDKLAKLIYLTNDVLYPHILDLTLKYSIMSKECAMTLLESDVVFWLLSRLELKASPHSTVPAFVCELTSSIIWRILSYLGKNKISEPMHLQDEIMKLLRNWFRKEVLYGQPQIRNDVAAIICRILYVFPGDNLLKSGLLEDIFLLAFATEFEIKHSWAKSVRFPPTVESLNLKKILILSICTVFKHAGIRTAADSYDVLPGLALLLNTKSGKSETATWPEEYKCVLVTYALQALPVLAGYFPEKYLACGATERILQLLENASSSGNSPEMMKCTLHCLSSLVIKGVCPEHFSERNTEQVLLNVAFTILEKPLSLVNQILLSHCFITISALSKCSIPRSTCYDLISSVGLEIVRRLFQPGKMDSKTNGRLTASAVDYVWHAIVRHSLIRKIFMDRGGLYLLLDLAKISSLPVQMLLMGVIADLSEDKSTIPQLVTWRGNSDQDTVLALLCTIWRKQEAVKGVKRDSKGCINDSDLTLQGKVEAKLTPSWKYCPAKSETMGCARPKIYAVFHNIMRRHYEASMSTKEVIGIDFQNISHQDEITLMIINNYEFFKKGEVWNNLWNGFLKMKITLLPHIETALFLLSKTYSYVAGNISVSQQAITAKEIRTELDKEKALCDNFRSFMLTEALDSFIAIRTDLYNTSKDYNLKSKLELEKQFANQRAKLDIDAAVPEYHPTRLLGINLSKTQPLTSARMRKNSTLLAAGEYLTQQDSKCSANKSLD